MDIPRRLVKVGNGVSKFIIRHISDTHHGAETFREDMFSEFKRQQINDPNSVWIHTGDVCDPDRNSRREIDNSVNANRHDEVRTQSEKNKLWVERHVIPKYRAIAKSCLGFLAGDHYMMIDGQPCTAYICKRLKVPYLGERSSFFNLVFQCQSVNSSFQYLIHARHGKGFASTPGGDVANLLKSEAQAVAELHLGGHTHKENCHPVKMHGVSFKGKYRQWVTWYVRGGSFLDGFPISGKNTYAYNKEYNPLPCGWAEIELTLARGGEVCESYQLQVRSSKASIIAA